MNLDLFFSIPLTDPVYVSAWLASLFFFVSRAVQQRDLSVWPVWRRLCEAVGVVALWAHIGLAYGLTHDWSHQAATQHVAERTEEVIGWRSGLGIYANFATAGIWTATGIFRLLWPHKRPGRNSSRNRGQSPPGRFYQLLAAIAEIYLWLMFVSASIIFALPIPAVFFTLLAALSPIKVSGTNNG